MPPSDIHIYATLVAFDLKGKNNTNWTFNCTVIHNEVKYLGYRLNAEVLHLIHKKWQPLCKILSHTDVNKFKSYSFLGFIHYYNKAHIYWPIAPLQ